MYSFIKPRKKVFFDSFTYLWITFILITSIGLIGFGFFIDKENKFFQNNLDNIKVEIQDIKDNIDKQKILINDYKLANLKYLEINKSNQLLENGIKNIFLLIPNQIQINRLFLERYHVKIYGKTNSPKTYKLLLEPPLKSIFDTSKVGFTKISDTEYLFTSDNKIKSSNNEKK